MSMLASSLNLFLGALTIAANLVSLGVIAAIIWPKIRTAAFFRFISERSMAVALLVSFIALAGSLAYSEVLGYEPCKLCWFQRIFMYPQAVIFAIALWKKDLAARVYGIALSAVGGAFAAFHYLGQIGLNPLGLDCLAVGYSVSCAKNFVLTFGYVTIPMMALSAFVLIALTLWLSLLGEKRAEIDAR